jgi:hypothetical protein
MPYAIRKRDDNFDVIRKDNGETISRHTSRAKAVKAIRAIYAHEKRGNIHPWFAPFRREDSR